MLIEIERLRFGHEADPPLNVRRVGRDEEIQSLAASIRAHGLINPLAVQTIEGVPYVVAGNRRLAALKFLALHLEATTAECREIAEGDALEISLAENFERLPLHQADQYEAFSDLAGRGLDVPAIARRFGVAETRVQKFLALGKLSPRVLDAWRTDKFGHDTVAIVQAFTLAPSLERQDEVLAKLMATDRVWANHVLAELGATNGLAQQNYVFVGREAYCEAGGRVTEDLFGAHHIVHDPDLARLLAERKLEAECAALVAAGWAWAKPVSDLPNDFSWKWDKMPSGAKATPDEQARLNELEAIFEEDESDAEGVLPDPALVTAQEEYDTLTATIEARKWTAEQRAKSGCAVSIGHNGILTITEGVIMPGAVAVKVAKGRPTAESAKAATKIEPEPKTISAALMERLSIAATKATQQAVVADPKVAIAAILAGALSHSEYFYGTRSPARILLKGMSSNSETRTDSGEDAFAGVLERLMAAPAEDVAAIAAKVLAVSIDMRISNPSSPPPVKVPAYAALIEAIEPTVWAEAIAASFDAEDYLKSVPKAFLLTAIGEAVNPDEARKIGAKPVAEIRAFALENVAESGWLPPELRASHYRNPWQAPAPAEAAKKSGTPAKGKRAGKSGKTAPVAEAAE